MPLADFRALDRAFHARSPGRAATRCSSSCTARCWPRLFRSDDFDSLLSADANQAEVERIVDRSVRHHAHDRQGASPPAMPVDAVGEAGTRHLDAVEQA